MRFSRDKRGYENTFVVHQDRRRGKSGSRVLYWFRTPPGIKVGRAALDEDAIRMLEECNPGVEFDWTRILKAEAPPPQEARPTMPQRRHGIPLRQPGSRRERDRDTRPASPSIQSAAPFPSERVPMPAPPVEPAQLDTEEAAALDEPLIGFEDHAIHLDDAATGPDDPIAAAAAVEIAQFANDAPSLLPSAAQARLGTEGIVRLRGRYAEILARIDERITEPARRDELKAQAERLNPDAWVTAPEVQAGLEQYEAVFEGLRAVVGRRRRRRRKRGARLPQPGSATAHTPPEDSDNTGDPEDL